MALIPAYNESLRIGEVIHGAAGQVQTVLVVDDGSTDDTAAVARQAGAQVLVHEKNAGKGASLCDGLDWMSREGLDVAVTLDADGQHAPEEIARFLAIAEDFDIIVGNRMQDTVTMPWLRRTTNQVTSSIVSRLARMPIHDSQCGFRLIRRTAWEQIRDSIRSRNFDFESEILVRAGRRGLRFGHVPVSTIYGDEVSKINPVTDTVRFFQLVWRLWRS